MNLVPANDPILTTVCSPFDFSNPAFDPNEFAQNLVKFMYDNNGIGLAANQVGVPYRIFAMRGAPENFVCFNPKLVLPSTQNVVLEESCLTYPGLVCKVKRAQHIKVRFATPAGEILTKTFTGMTARVFQHQMDYMDGIVFYTKANKFHKDQAMRKWKK